jgi:hypothetical protein
MIKLVIIIILNVTPKLTRGKAQVTGRECQQKKIILFKKNIKLTLFWPSFYIKKNQQDFDLGFAWGLSPSQHRFLIKWDRVNHSSIFLKLESFQALN